MTPRLTLDQQNLTPEEHDLRVCAIWNEFGASHAFDLVMNAIQSLKMTLYNQLMAPGERDRDFFSGKVAALEEIQQVILQATKIDPEAMKAHYAREREEKAAAPEVTSTENPVSSEDPLY